MRRHPKIQSKLPEFFPPMDRENNKINTGLTADNFIDLTAESEDEAVSAKIGKRKRKRE